MYTTSNMKRKIALGVVTIAMSILVIFLYLRYIQGNVNDNQNNGENTPFSQSSNNATDQSTNTTPKAPSDANDVAFVVNKKSPLPDNYTPSDLEVPSVELRLDQNEEQMQVRAQTARALEQMFADAEKQGLRLILGSGYRSYELQQTFYDQYSKQSGQSEADTFSARPGYSEHQTGLAVDIVNKSQTCSLEACFAETPEGIWIKHNSHKYGFIIRYQREWKYITGYTYEPWHLRYIGTEISNKLYAANMPLEQYFGLPAAPEY